MNETNYDETIETLRLFAKSGERVIVAFQFANDGWTRKVEGTMSTDEARIAIDIAASVGATRFTVFRHDG